ncbi:heterokaryon incompatibility protein-domain-containing protein [Lineolata rhizophorae]|uniref:Heterokaryon incompatibility protein-domain-containing protein n=1 Tax=Lineolata rhizophorae TaxID=578093 RepID=A0A6A6NUI4_9PEZI|nr:heterokaryon incompatibility protein-domain-containing protein [Lineolata rhizophorae]
MRQLQAVGMQALAREGTAMQCAQQPLEYLASLSNDADSPLRCTFYRNIHHIDPGIGVEDATYIYEPLDDSTTWIRILELQPSANPTAPICCHLHSMPISYAPTYEAISYVWGAEPASRLVQCSGRNLAIKPNLHDALMRLRLPIRPRFLWADAVCIDQADARERSHQVRLMRRIYRDAAAVLVWLGQDTGGVAGEALEGVRSIRRGYVPPVERHSLWSAIAALFGAAWFWRVWVVQEIVLGGAQAEVLWGDEAHAEWMDVGFAAAWIRSAGYQLMQRHAMPGVFNAYMMYRLSMKEIDVPPVTFLRLLTLTRQFRCSDPRDRVFGLLGLPMEEVDTDKGEVFLEPSYAKSTAEVYVELARKVLDKMRTLHLLSAVQHGLDMEEELPSWVPQWDRCFVRTLAPSDPGVGTFSAAKGICIAELLSPCADALLLHGIEFDTLTFVSDIIPDKHHSRNAARFMTSLWENHVKPLGSHLSYPSLEKAFCWTLSTGKDWYGMLVENESEHIADFDAFLGDRVDCFAPVDQTFYRAVITRGDPERFSEAASNGCGGRRFFLTSKGYMGVGPPTLRDGDRVCVLYGGIVPFLLRLRDGHWKLVGEAYVHGLMDGEAVDSLGQPDGGKGIVFEIR